MRLVTSNQLSDLAEIYSDDVELVNVARPNFERVESLSQRLILSRQAHQIQWIQPLHAPNLAEGQLPESIETNVRLMLVDQITEGCDVLGELLGCTKVGVRLATLRSPMCPSFHVDKIPCRLLITLSGGGTEWIPNSDVDWAVFTDPADQNIPLRPGTTVRKLPAGHWSLLKGGAWSRTYHGVVHRSPRENGERLLLSLDPIFH